jgi:predicted type IV restriction endonuclease
MEVFCDVSTETMADIKELASIAGAEVASIISYCLDLGVSVAVISEISKRKQEKKERTKERKEQKKNIYTNTSLKGGLGENSLAKPKKKLQKKLMPVKWVQSADRGEWPPEKDDLIRLAKNHNFEEAAAKEFFLMFVSHHASKGQLYKDWKRAWTTWILHQKKFNPEKAGKRSDSVVRSYQTLKPLEGMFDDKA